MDPLLVYTSPSNSIPSPLSATEEASVQVFAAKARRGSTSIDAVAPEGKRPRSVGRSDSGYFSDASSSSTSSHPSSLEQWLKELLPASSFAASRVDATTAAADESSKHIITATPLVDDTALDMDEDEDEVDTLPRPRLTGVNSMPHHSTARRTPPPAPAPANLEEEPASPRPSALPSRFDARPGATRAFTAPTRSNLAELSAKALARSQAIAAATDAQFSAQLEQSTVVAPNAANVEVASTVAVARSAEMLNKDRFVAGLVGASVLAIESIWGAASSSEPAGAAEGNVLPLHWFVKEVLRRSRTSCSTLQLALYYLHKSRRTIRETVARAEATREEYSRLESRLRRKALSVASGDSYPSPPLSPRDRDYASDEARFDQLVEAQQSPVLCGRRMFLAALIAASKYLQDRNYSNRAWARISGLPVHEINANERAFLCMIGFSLHLDAHDFHKWTQRLSALTAQGAALETAAAKPTSAHNVAAARLGLARSQSELPAAEPLSEGPVRQRCPVGDSVALGRMQSHPELVTSRREAVMVKAKVDVEPRQQPSPEDSDDGSSVGSSGEDDASSSSSSSKSISTTASGRKVRGLPSRRAGVPLTRSNTSMRTGSSTAWPSSRVAHSASYAVAADVDAVAEGAAALSWGRSSRQRSVVV